MLLFFDQNFDFKSIERNRFHKIALTELCAVKHVQFTNMLLEENGAGEIKRLAQFVQNGHPAL